MRYWPQHNPQYGLVFFLLLFDHRITYRTFLSRFGITDNRPHSCGTIYAAVNNLHRSHRYLADSTAILTTIPGPFEPRLEQQNHILEPIKDGLKKLYAGKTNFVSVLTVDDKKKNTGMLMNVYGRRLPAQVHVIASMQASDIPASRKFSGSAGHSHKTHPCNVCYLTTADINTPAGYDIPSIVSPLVLLQRPDVDSNVDFKLRDDFIQLKHAFQSYHASTKKARTEILDKYGARFTEMNWLPGWLPVKSSPLDYMHNLYGQICAPPLILLRHFPVRNCQGFLDRGYRCWLLVRQGSMARI